jgi:hypothetical protein
MTDSGPVDSIKVAIGWDRIKFLDLESPSLAQESEAAMPIRVGWPPMTQQTFTEKKPPIAALRCPDQAL